MRKKFILLLLSGILTGAPLGAVDITDVSRAVWRSGQIRNGQFDEMRNDLFSRQKEKYNGLDLWLNTQKDNNVYALAVYLYNMYLLREIYGPSAEKTISLNALGALDAVSRLKTAFPFEQTEKLYRKHQAQIQAQLSFFFQVAYRAYPHDTAQEENWVALLSRAGVANPKRIKPFYTLPDNLRLQGEYVRADISFLIPALRSAQAESTHKVILFDKSQATLEDFDSMLARSGHTQTEHTYRWVKDECEYSSYVLGKHLLQAAQSAPEKWQKTRIYKMTARPPKGTFYLRPAQGERFTLAGGETASKWQYHTAVLLVLQTGEGRYVPLVLDNFLGEAEAPFTLAQWLAYFNGETQFEAVPFETNTEVEAAIQTPQEVINPARKIRVNGVVYQPAKIEQ
jgi:hypothetical protein